MMDGGDLNPTHATATGRWRCAAACLALVLSGCATDREPDGDGTAVIHVSEYHRIFDAAIGVLRDEGMTIDRQDSRFGVITTKPLGAPTLFEPWRPGNRTVGQALDSTVNDQRRQVTVTLSPRPPSRDASVISEDGASTVIDVHAEPTEVAADAFLLRVDVQVERQEVPTNYLTGSMAGHAVMGRLYVTPEELLRRNVAGSYWQPVGRDVALERRLAAAIIRQSMEQ